jgi:hypothetical protein
VKRNSNRTPSSLLFIHGCTGEAGTRNSGLQTLETNGIISEQAKKKGRKSYQLNCKQHVDRMAENTFPSKSLKYKPKGTRNVESQEVDGKKYSELRNSERD